MRKWHHAGIGRMNVHFRFRFWHSHRLSRGLTEKSLQNTRGDSGPKGIGFTEHTTTAERSGVTIFQYLWRNKLAKAFTQGTNWMMLDFCQPIGQFLRQRTWLSTQCRQVETGKILATVFHVVLSHNTTWSWAQIYMLKWLNLVPFMVVSDLYSRFIYTSGYNLLPFYSPVHLRHIPRCLLSEDHHFDYSKIYSWELNRSQIYNLHQSVTNE